MWGDLTELFSGISDYVSGAFNSATEALGAVGTAIADIPGIAASAASSIMPNLLGGSADIASSADGSMLGAAREGIGSVATGFAAPAATAASEAASFTVDPMETIFGSAEDPMMKALTTAPRTSMLDQMIADAARGATSAPTAGGSKGLVQSVLDFAKSNPMAVATAAGVVKGAFSPNAVEVAREKARAELQAKLQLAQWLKDNNRAGGVGVSLNMRPVGTPGAVQRLTGEPVYQRGGLIAPYITRGA